MKLSITIYFAAAALLMSTPTMQSQQLTQSGAQITKQPKYTVLHTFTSATDGAIPNYGAQDGALVRDKAGNLYGTTGAGGAINSYCPAGCGVVFKIDPAGKETILHTFSGPPDGALPSAALILDNDGNLYGTTVGGGNASLGAGTVFKVERQGKETVLYSFGGGTDGNSPYAGLIQDGAGTLYGTTFGGGAAGAGVVFKLDRTGREKVLYNFTGGADGGYPQTGLIRDEIGNLYGTTSSGGNSGHGVVFKLNPAGYEKALYAFSGGADGGQPGELIRDDFGNFYGTAATGGSLAGTCSYSFGCGVIFKLNAAGKQSVLFTFGGEISGSTAYGPLLLHEGFLYGTTFFGGDTSVCLPFGCGVVFKLDQAGKETVLHTFTGEADGGNSSAGLIAGDDGSLYGTTSYGGDLSNPQPACYGAGCGVVFEIKPQELCDVPGRAATETPSISRVAHCIKQFLNPDAWVWIPGR